MGAKEKTWIALGLVILALLEFFTAMYVYGRKGPKKYGKLMLTIHRITGYVFLLYFIWVIYIGVVLYERLAGPGTGWEMDARIFGHALLAVLLIMLLLLKISFVRIYTNFRPYAPMLGIVLSVGTILVWLVAGWFWLISLGSMAFE